MNIITREANVNALRQVENLDVLLFEGEVNAHMFRIKPVEGIDFTGATIVGTFLRSDNQRVQVETGAVVDGNAEITLTAGCYAVPGRYRWTIYMVTADETACIYAACGTVQATQGSGTAGDTEPIIEPTAPDLTPITDRLDALEAIPIKVGTADKSLILNSGRAAMAENAVAENRGAAYAANSHAEGFASTGGVYSHAEGYGTIASRRCHHVFGEYNLEDNATGASGTDRGTYIEVVGNGNTSQQRSNARTLDWSGNEALAGGLTLGKGTSNETTITAAQLKALLALLS